MELALLIIFVVCCIPVCMLKGQEVRARQAVIELARKQGIEV